MSIYVARSPYRTTFGSRPKLKISFPRIGELFSGKAARRVRPQLESAPRGLQHDTSLRGGAMRGAGSFGKFASNVKAKTLTMEFGPNSVIVGLMFVAVLLSLLYLMHFNRVATKGYDINRLDASRQQLLLQYDIKNMKLAEIKSLNNMVQSGKMEGMRHPTEVAYVSGGTTAYASLNFN